MEVVLVLYFWVGFNGIRLAVCTREERIVMGFG